MRQSINAPTAISIIDRNNAYSFKPQEDLKANING
jgi:hypothetical protein